VPQWIQAGRRLEYDAVKESDRLEVERVGGFAGFGGGHLRSRGSLAGRQLTPKERERIDALMTGRGLTAPATPDGFRYRLTLAGSGRSVEVGEADVPPAVRDCVRDELV